MAKAVAFYTEILGLRLQYRAEDHFAIIDAGDGAIFEEEDFVVGGGVEHFGEGLD